MSEKKFKKSQHFLFILCKCIQGRSYFLWGLTSSCMVCWWEEEERGKLQKEESNSGEGVPASQFISAFPFQTSLPAPTEISPPPFPYLCLSAEVRAGSEQAAHMWTCLWESTHTVINTSKHCKGEMLDGRVNLVIRMKYTIKTISFLSSMTLSNNASDSFFFIKM